MANEVQLTGAMRANLLSLQETSKLIMLTQEHLATGKKINSALDDPARYFSAQGHLSRASDLDRLKAAMGESIQTIRAADQGITAVIALIEQARGLADSARTSTAKAALAQEFNALVAQMKDLVADAGYKGINLLTNQNMVTQFEGTHNLSTTGINTLDANFIAGLNNAVDNANGGYNGFATESDVANAIADINDVLANFRSAGATLAANLSVITTRQDFTAGMIATLKAGAANLTEADQNEEGANMLMLQTRQQLGTVSLQMASEAAQSILRLF
jgi:flagellin-like hook-associated protein FlgL